MNIRIQIVAFILFLLIGSTTAQNRAIDSLRHIIGMDKKNLAQMECLNELSAEYVYIGLYDSAIWCSNQSMKLGRLLLLSADAKTQKEIKNVLNWTHYVTGDSYLRTGNYPEALKNFIEALKLCEEIDYRPGISLNHNYIGIVNELQENYDEALKHYFISLDTDKSLKRETDIAYDHNLIGLVYWKQNKLHDALNFYNESYKIFNQLKDNDGLAAVYGNMAILYGIWAKNALTGRNKKSADSLFLIAEKYHFSALEKFELTKHPDGIANTHNNIGELYISFGKYSAAKTHLSEGLRLGRELQLLERIKDSYLQLYTLDSATNNFKGAMQNYKLFISCRDSLINEENTKKTVQVQMRYEFDKKESAAKVEQEKKDSLALEEKKKQIIIRNSFIGGFGLVLLLAALIFRGYRNKQKANKTITLQKLEVEKAKEVIEEQKLIVEEKQKEVIDSIRYAQRIQKALITNEKYIEKNIMRLKNSKF